MLAALAASQELASAKPAGLQNLLVLQTLLVYSSDTARTLFKNFRFHQSVATTSKEIVVPSKCCPMDSTHIFLWGGAHDTESRFSPFLPPPVSLQQFQSSLWDGGTGFLSLFSHVPAPTGAPHPFASSWQVFPLIGSFFFSHKSTSTHP